MSMPPELLKELPQEFLVMIEKNAEIIGEIQVEPVKIFKLSIRGESVFLEGSTYKVGLQLLPGLELESSGRVATEDRNTCRANIMVV
jgi:hypothetical protein